MPKALNMRVNTSNVDRLAGYLTSFSEQIKTDQLLGTVIDSVHATMAEEFDITMDAMAQVSPEKYHHVYDWGQLGDADGRLWRDVLAGRGSRRIATFEWLPSQNIVPTEDGQQPIHVFVWKAPVMEYNDVVTVTPKLAKHLVFRYNGEMQFRAGATHPNPGGPLTTGSFTAAYTDFFGGAAGQQAFRRAMDGVSGEFKPTRIGSSMRMKNVSFRSIGNDAAAFEEGAIAARNFLSKIKTRFIDQAAARRS